MTLEQLRKQVRELIRKGETNKAFEVLAQNLDQERPVFNELVQINARWSDTFKREMGGTLERDQVCQEYSRVETRLLNLLKELINDDLGAGGSLEDPFDAFVRELILKGPLTHPIYIVNCDRKQPIQYFWKRFDHYNEARSQLQLYLTATCPSQEPEGFVERAVYELLKEELQGQIHSLDYRRRAADNRLVIERFPLGRNVARSKAEFVKYFAERYGLSHECAFEEWVRGGMAGVGSPYVVAAFFLEHDEWNQDVMGEYLRWMADCFAAGNAPEAPCLIVFLIVHVKHAERQTLPDDLREVRDGAEQVTRQDPKRISWIAPLPPVPVHDLEAWLEKVGETDTGQKEQLVKLMRCRMATDEKRRRFDQEKLINMEHIIRFQQKVYERANNEEAL